MTNRLKSIHRAIPYVRSLQVVCFPTISKILRMQKKKKAKQNKTKLIRLISK